MKFLRVLTNAVLSGLFISFLLALLIVDLNINLKPTPLIFKQLTVAVAAFYGVGIAVLSILFYYFIRFFSGRPYSIAWISPSFLCLSFSLLLIPFLVVFKVNAQYFQSFFDPAMKAAVEAQFLTLLFAALLGLLLFYVDRRRGRKKLYLAGFFPLLAAALVFVFLARWNYLPPQPFSRSTGLEAKKVDRKIFLLRLDGLSYDFIIPYVSEGKLPNFSWLMEQGSWGKIETFSPTDTEILKASMETGKYPSKHRLISSIRYRILNQDAGIEVVPRFMLFRQLTRIGALKILPQQTGPASRTLWRVLKDNGVSWVNRDAPPSQVSGDLAPKMEKSFAGVFKEMAEQKNQSINRVREAFYGDFDWEDQAMEEKNKVQPQIFQLALNGLNTVETFFYKYSFPQLFGNIDQESISRYGSVIEKYYHYYDQLLGIYLTSLKEDELLVVYSLHGIEPLPPWKRFVEWILGNPEVSAYYEFAPGGVVFFFGKNIAKGKTAENIRLIDITPTLLYAMGLPVGRDMDGIVRSSIFQPDFIAENPIFYISSYDEVEIRRPK